MSTIDSTTPAPLPGEALPRYTPPPGAVEGLAREPRPTPPSRTRAIRPALSAAALHIVLALVSLGMVIPFLWMILTSLKTLDEVGIPSWLPRFAQWDNYAEVF